MAIPLVKESEKDFIEFGFYEKCYFECGNNTAYWHWRTNQPVCKSCSKIHKVVELPKCTPTYKVPTKKQYINSI